MSTLFFFFSQSFGRKQNKEVSFSKKGLDTHFHTFVQPK